MENFYTRFQTTVGGSGYTAGSGVLDVATTVGTAAVFRVIITDQSTGAYKALLKVTGVNSSTQYAVTVDPGGVDANCATGDIVRANLSADALYQLLHPSGASVIAASDFNNTVGNFQSYSILALLRGFDLQAFPSSFRLWLSFTAGSPVIGAMKVLKVAIGTLTPVLSFTNVQIGGNSSPTLTSPALVETDAIALQLDPAYDYWFAIFFTNTGANASVVVSSGTSGAIKSGYISGDHTADTTIPSLLGFSGPLLIAAAVNA